MDFGNNPAAYGFDTYYDVLSNSCVDFFWKAMEVGGLNKGRYEGSLWPTDNIEDLRRFIDLSPVEIKRVDDFLRRTFPDTWNVPIAPTINDVFRTATTPVRRDPLAIDLDADGIETVGVTTAPVLFDHNADGIRTGTGWVAPDDAWLVLDRDGNGSIDSGRELFGVDTQITVTETVNGVLSTVTRNATSGFEALRTLDANGDGQFDAQDAAFGQVQLWRDLNQDGISQADELSLLADHNIVSIGLTPASTATTNLGNGNTVTGTATVTTGDGGSTQIDSVDLSAGNLNLADNPFYRDFTDTIPLTDAASSLPEMGGAGVLRDLREAMSLGTPQAQALTQAVQALAGADTRDAQRALLDPLLAAWAGTARPVTSTARSLPGLMEHVAFIANWFDPTPINDRFGPALAERGLDWRAVLGDHPGAAEVQALGQMLQQAGLIGGWNLTQASIPVATLSLNYWTQSAWDVFAQAQPELAQRIATLEQFNGVQAFSNGAFMTRIVNGGGNGQDTYAVTVPQANVDLFNQAYAALQESVYGSLVMQTRLQPYLDAVELVIDETGIRFDAAGLAALIETKRGGDERNALIDLIELNRYALDTLGAVGFDGLGVLRGWMEGMASDSPLRGTLAEMHVGVLVSGSGSASSDILYGTAAENSISAGGGNDVVVGDAGADTLQGGDGDDVLDGGADNDHLYGQAGSDSLVGGTGNDTLYGDAGNDTLDGGSGNDWLEGGAGNDTYIWGKGSGQDTAQNYDTSAGRFDVVKVSAGTAPSDVVVSRSGDDIYLSITGTTDTLRLYNVLSSDGASSYALNQVLFDDGTAWSLDTLKAMLLVGTANGETITGYASDDTIDAAGGNDTVSGRAGNDMILGGAGNDTLYGEAGNDTLDGGSGNDWLEGGAGNDTYVWGKGSGQDTAQNYDTSAGRFDVVQVSAGTAPSEVVVSRSGDDIYLSIVGTTDTLRLYNVLSGDGASSYALNQVRFDDGTAWSLETLKAMLLVGTANGETITGYASDDTLDAAGGNDTVSGRAGNDMILGGAGNDTLYGEAANDTLDGGSGNDWLEGGAGNDTYVWGKGSGQDTAQNYDTSAGRFDVVKVSAGTAPSDVVVSRSGDDIYLSITGTTDTLRLYNVLSSDGASSYALNQVRFDDGTAWSLDTLKAMLLVGTANGETITGYASDDTIDAAGGNDTVSGRAGNDMILGGAGNDTLYGEAGNDTLDGGSGNDWLEGGAGNDTYIWGKGSGQDTAQNYDTSAGRFDVVQVSAGTAPSEVVVSRSGDDIYLGIVGTTDTLRLYNVLSSDGASSYALNQVRFDDGTAWSLDTLKAMLLVGTANGETITGYASDDTIDAAGGNDTVSGRAGNDMILGGAGNDTLYGEAGNDTLDGGSGNDWLEGGAGNDTYVWGKGSGQDTAQNYDTSAGRFDVVKVSAGTAPSDVVVSRSGDDIYLSITGTTDTLRLYNVLSSDGASSYALNQVRFDDGTAWSLDTLKAMLLVGTANGETITGYASDDTIDAAGGNDTVSGRAGNDMILGGAGNDTLYGEAGNDTLDGGSGNDWLEGGAGNDTYIWGKGSGQDTAQNYDTSAGRFDVVQVSAGTAPSEVVVSRSGDDIYLGIVGTTDTLRLYNVLSSDGASSYALNQVRFSDGTAWSIDTLKTKLLLAGTDNGETIIGYASDDTIDAAGGNDTVSGRAGNDMMLGGAGNDTLYGETGNDTLDGGSGNDWLEGGAGNDTYIWGKGSGQDTAQNYDTSAGRFDVVQVSAGTAPSEVVVSRSGDDIYLSIVGTTDTLRLYNVLSSDGASSYALNQVRFDDGTAWSLDTLKVMLLNGTASGETITGYASDDTIDAAGGNDTVSGRAGNDMIRGGAGNDTLYGEAGNDTLEGGSGNDWLEGGAGNDTYIWGKGSGQDTAQNYDTSAGRFDVVQVSAGTAPSEVVVSRSGDDIYLSIVGTTDTLRLYNVLSSDGASSYALNQVRFDDGTAWSLDTLKVMLLNGTASGETITGYASDDTIDAAGGNDTVSGRAGNDMIRGGAGNDTLYGEAGNDTLEGGSGNDWLEGGAGNDTYIWGKGSGQDTAQNYDTSAGRFDVVQVSAGTAPSEVVVSRSGDDIYLSIVGTTDTLRLYNVLSSDGASSYALNQVRFDDGTAWSLDTLKAMLLVGTANGETITGYASDDTIDAAGGNDTVSGRAGNDMIRGGAGGDTLYGEAGNDTLDGGPGTDTLNGGIGNDTYLFTPGTGSDTLSDYDTTTGNTDLLSFGTGITAEQLWFRQVGNNLEVSLIGTTDKATISNWYSGSAYHVEQFKTSDGKTLLDSQVQALVSAMAAFAPPAAGQTGLPADYQAALAPVIASNWV